VGPMIGVKS